MYLLPYLTIGGSRKDFWGMTPKELDLDFRAYQNRVNNQLQMAWINGLYVKAALKSTILTCGLADKNVVSNLPKYPEMPKQQNHDEDRELSEEEIQAETQYAIAKMEYWTKTNNKRMKK